ncbi:hypothetical protein Pan216_11530 [Planctomycetes bacterium Pan216]|uniref:Peptidase C-terminal archaeal/bacterial domain-containing protein n=1 Tax=Kolteria novifilia TaxID=2527975 RepID=A0A518B033_9BACT|nr:hypothetical protein Pan216_11530 [Planctomycetes bacterium Pan216]
MSPHRPMKPARTIPFAWSIGVTVLLTGTAIANLPVARLATIRPAGAQRGTSTAVTIEGSDLDEVDRLLFSHPGISATPHKRAPALFEEGEQLVTNRFTVNIAKEIPPGLYEVRAVGHFGVSNPRIFAVGLSPEAEEKEPNSKPADAQEVSLDTTINGRIDSPGDQDLYHFQGKKGQSLTAQLLGQRIDSEIEARLVLLDPDGQALAKSRPVFSKDPLLHALLPADGDYVLRVEDIRYAGGARYPYRLELSTKPLVTSAFPLAGPAGRRSSFTLYGYNLPGGAPRSKRDDGDPNLQRLSVLVDVPPGAGNDRPRETSFPPVSDAFIDSFTYRLPARRGPSNPLRLGIATEAIVREHEPNDHPDSAHRIPIPCEVAGRFDHSADRDWFLFDGNRGEQFVIDVVAQRLGQPTDPLLVVEQVSPNRRQLTETDDAVPAGADFVTSTHSDDPTFRLSIPEDGTYRVLVYDQFGGLSTKARDGYRLLIRRAVPDFNLIAIPRQITSDRNRSALWSTFLRRGQTDRVEVLAFRRDGFSGPIVLTAEGLPQGVSASPITIAPGQSRGSLILRADDNAPAFAGPWRIVGKATIDKREVTHEASAGTLVESAVRDQHSGDTRLASRLMLGVGAAESYPFSVGLGTPILETSRAGKLEIPVRIKRRGDFKEAVVLTPVNLPPRAKAAAVTIAKDKSEGTIAVTVESAAPLGTFSSYLRAQATVPYRRTPGAAARAEERKKRAIAATANLGQEIAEVDKRQKGLAAEITKQLAATKQLEQREKEARAKLTTIKPEEKAAVDKEIATLTKQFAEARAALDRAKAEQARIDQQLKRQREQFATFEKAKKESEDAAKRAADVAKPRKIRVEIPSPSITLAIVEAPVRTQFPDVVGLEQGATIDVPLAVERLFGFADPVTLKATIGGSVKGLTAAPTTIEKGSSESLLKVAAIRETPTGRHAIPIELSLKFNNQTLKLARTLTVEITPAPAPQAPPANAK